MNRLQHAARNTPGMQNVIRRFGTTRSTHPKAGYQFNNQDGTKNVNRHPNQT